MIMPRGSREERWLPQCYQLSNAICITKPICLHEKFQIYKTTSNSEMVLIIDNHLRKLWTEDGLVPEGLIKDFCYEGKELYYLVSGSNNALCFITDCDYPRDLSQAMVFVHSLKRTREVFPNHDLYDSIYYEQQL